MNKIIAFFLLASPCLASGPKYIGTSTDPLIYQEFLNVYQDLRNPNINTGICSTCTITNGIFNTVTSTSINTQNINGTFIGMGRNRFINGDILIDQANGGAAVTVNTSSTFFSVDMILATGITSAGVYTLQQQTSSPPTGFQNYLRATCTTADASIASTDLYRIVSQVEGYAIRDFLMGSSSAKTATLSFWARSSLTGTYTGSFRNNNADRSYPFEYTINSANTWELKSITFASDTTGTWLNTNGTGLSITWILALGSNFIGTANTWAGSNLSGTANQVNFMSSNTSRTWDITGIQLELGSTATAFEFLPFQTELELSQRYFEKSYLLAVAPGTNDTNNPWMMTASVVGTNTTEPGEISFKVQKRVAPTITTYTRSGTSGQYDWVPASGSPATQTTTSNNVGTNGFSIFQTASSTYLWCLGHWVADARL